MLSFDLSATNILLLTAAVALLILFITVLMKLNPSTQEKETYERKITLDRQKPSFQNEPSLPPKPLPVAKENVQATIEKPLMPVNTTVEELSLQKNQENKTPIVSQSKEAISKLQKTVAPRAQSSNSSKRDCLHQFGYLRTLPKNTPIPDECLGCQRVVECLVEAKKR